AAAQEQFRQNQPYYQQQQTGDMRAADDGYDESDNEQPEIGGEPFAPREQQPYHPREQHHHNQQQHYQPQQQHGQPQHGQPQHGQPQHGQPQHGQQHFQPRPQHPAPESDGDVERLPSFITGNQPQPQQPQQGQGG